MEEIPPIDVPKSSQNESQGFHGDGVSTAEMDSKRNAKGGAEPKVLGRPLPKEDGKSTDFAKPEASICKTEAIEAGRARHPEHSDLGPQHDDLLKPVSKLSVASDPHILPEANEVAFTSPKLSEAPHSLRLAGSLPKDDAYLDPTPQTPLNSNPPSRSHSVIASRPEESEGGEMVDLPPQRAAQETSEAIKMKQLQSQDASSIPETDSQPEIQSIMDQFDEGREALGEVEVMSPRLELANPLLGAPIQHPPRRSSLEPLRTKRMSSVAAEANNTTLSHNAEVFSTSPTEHAPTLPPKDKQQKALAIEQHSAAASPAAARTFSPSSGQAPFPQPDPEPDLPFDFHRFLEQLRHRTADPVAKFLRSFLMEFGKKQWMVHEQVKIIGDFLAFITDKMAQCEVWKGVSDAEFDNAREGMEKLVMNRLYSQTFSPAIPPSPPTAGSRGKRRQTERIPAPGRRGQHQEDVERDDILAQKVRIYGWITEEHLDIHPVGDGGRRFLTLAQQELLKIKTYRAPRDKVICVLNCCKVIFGLLRNSKSDQSADSFVPLLIYVVLQANPEHLVSNVQYIMRFRHQDKLGGEAGYYLSSLMGAIQFIESLDRTSLTISAEEFERHVEAAVSTIAEKHLSHGNSASPTQPSSYTPHMPEKSTISPPVGNARASSGISYSTPRLSTSPRRSSDLVLGVEDEKAAVAGLLRTIQRPLSSISKLFSDEGMNTQSQRASTSAAPGSSASPLVSSTRSQRLPPSDGKVEGAVARDQRPTGDRVTLKAEDAAARQASAETAEAARIRSEEHKNVVETLSGMFPDLDTDVIDDVVRMKEGRVGLAVDACLALSS